MATVLISGGSGLIGSALTPQLIAKGYDVIILTRKKNKQSNMPHLSYAHWNIERQIIDKAAIKKADYIIHLAGANVAEKHWTKSRKKEIANSRTKSGALLVKGLRDIPNKVQAVVSASAIGWYGPDPQILNPKPFVETDAPAHDFLGTTCQQWEASILPVMELGKRLVILRTGIVLSTNGGAYAEFKKPLQFGVASILGSGKQIVSWIHIDDIAGLYLYALENNHMQGIYNAVAPEPVSNKELIQTIAKEKGSIYIPVHIPAFVLKTVLGEMSIEVLKSATVSSAKVVAAGYSFLFPNIKVAMESLQKQH